MSTFSSFFSCPNRQSGEKLEIMVENIEKNNVQTQIPAGNLYNVGKIGCSYDFKREHLNEMVRLRTEEKKTFGEIALMFGLKSTMAIYTLFDKNGISTKNLNTKKTPELIAKIIELYRQGLSSRKIAPLVNYTQSNIIDILRDNGIERRPAGYFNWDRTYTLNEDFFDVIDSYQKAYALGLLFSDGNLGYRPEKSNYAFSFFFQHSDAYVLEEVNKWFGSNRPLQKGPVLSTLAFSSEKMCLRLLELGLIPNKTYIGQMPTEKQLPRHLFCHFMRALIDANGWMTWQNQRPNQLEVGICFGSETMITSLYYHLKYLYGIDGRVEFSKDSYSHKLIIERVEDVKKVYTLFYNNDCLAMKRKKDKLVEFMAKRAKIDSEYVPVYIERDGVKLKKCYICNQYKTYDLFRSNKSKEDGISCECKVCKTAKDATYYKRKQAEKKALINQANKNVDTGQPTNS